MSTSTTSSGSRCIVVCVGVLLLGLGGCQTSPPAQAPAPPPVAGAFPIPPGAHEYTVDAARSLLQIFVYRGGAMARLGHNHVIASHQLAGSVYLTDDPLATRFDVSFPVNELTVDEPALREAAGADFPPGVPQSAREGTRGNLLSEALLDGTHFPTIRLRATGVKAAANGYDIGVEVTLKGETHALRVPADVRRANGELTASGEFPLTQTELGLKPFSVAMGTLVVLDQMRVRFEVTARE